MTRRTKNQAATDRRNATRDLMKLLPDFCAARGYLMPAEFLVMVMNGVDPRSGCDVDIDDALEKGVSLQDSVAAAKTLAKYLYTTASQVDITTGGRELPPVVVTPEVARTLHEKLKEVL